jgi:hypothetical protein
MQKLKIILLGCQLFLCSFKFSLLVIENIFFKGGKFI